jgi:hypothetical protein
VFKQLGRLEKGEERIDADLVVRIARTFGVELNDLVFTHEVCCGEGGVGRDNPIAALEEERDDKFEAALQQYRVALAPLGGEESFRRLAADIADPGTEKEPRYPWQTAGSAVPRDRWPDAVRRLEDLLCDRTTPVDRLAADLREAAGGLERAGYRVGVGRHIGVEDGPDKLLGEPVRRVTVVVSAEPGDVDVQVDLLPSLQCKPTWREERLMMGDRSVVPEIRRDIAWCGHWEGRWFPYLPLDAPDWLKEKAERRAGV